MSSGCCLFEKQRNYFYLKEAMKGLFNIDWDSLAVPQIELDFDGVFDTKSNEGCICIKCEEFNPYAEPNQIDGTFKCYSCRKYG